MAIGNMLAGIGGFFDGWKSMNDIIKSHQEMLGRQEQIEGYQAGKALSDEDARAIERRRADPTYGGDYGGGGEISATSGSSTAPVPPEVRAEQLVNRGDPELWAQIKPYIFRLEGGNSYTKGFGGVDISKYPEKPGYYGFPDWPGATYNGKPTHAAGFAQFQPDTWKQYAPIAGVNDFSPESQEKVAYQAYLAEGLRPWVPYNPALKTALAKAGLLGGVPTTAARRGAAPEAPDLEGQRAGVTAPSALGDTGGDYPTGATTAAPTATSPTSALGSTGSPSPYLAVGDSIATGYKRFAGVPGKISLSRKDPNFNSADAAAGRNPQEVLDYINGAVAYDPNYFAGKQIILSSGVSNNPDQHKLVQDQLKALKKAKAGGIHLVGVGGRAGREDNQDYDLRPYNPVLQGYANEAGARFGGELPAVVHPPREYYPGSIPGLPGVRADAGSALDGTFQTAFVV